MPTPASDIRDYQPMYPRTEYAKTVQHIALYNGGSEKMAKLLLDSIIEGDCPSLAFVGELPEAREGNL